MQTDGAEELKAILDTLYREYDFKGRLLHDPLVFAHRYTEPKDQEVVAFIASSFAYGKVRLFFRVIEALLERLGPSPYEFLLKEDLKSGANLFRGIYYRLSKDGDILRFLYGLSKTLRNYSCLEGLFISIKRENLKEKAGAFLNKVRQFALEMEELRGFDYSKRGLAHLLPELKGGSPAKRFNLFLRWMVRDRDIDLGIWKCMKPSELVIPLDTHIARISRCIGLTTKKSPSWKMAEEITNTLKRFDPEDPLKYDFVLCHEGIKGYCERLCGGKRSCPLETRKNHS